MYHRGAMRFAYRIGSLLVALLLLQVPATLACESPEQMPPDCPMAGIAGMDHTQMAGMHHTAPPESPTSDSRCGNCGSLADECCALKSAPEPVQTRSGDGSQGRLAVTFVEQQSPGLAPLCEEPSPNGRGTGPPDLHDVGRYTLHSAYLL